MCVLVWALVGQMKEYSFNTHQIFHRNVARDSMPQVFSHHWQHSDTVHIALNMPLQGSTNQMTQTAGVMNAFKRCIHVIMQPSHMEVFHVWITLMLPCSQDTDAQTVGLLPPLYNNYAALVTVWLKLTRIHQCSWMPSNFQSGYYQIPTDGRLHSRTLGIP